MTDGRQGGTIRQTRSAAEEGTRTRSVTICDDGTSQECHDGQAGGTDILGASDMGRVLVEAGDEPGLVIRPTLDDVQYRK
jgi:Tfp pilus assembly protein FimT